MISEELVQHFTGAISLPVGTCSDDLQPGFGITGEAGSDKVTVYIPKVASAQIEKDLEKNKQLSLIEN
ncbi:MAG: hypothetical protein ABUK01_08565 [Leptospirales bacterium]